MGNRLAAITKESYDLNAKMNATMTERFGVAGALLSKLFVRPEAETESWLPLPPNTVAFVPFTDTTVSLFPDPPSRETWLLPVSNRYRLFPDPPTRLTFVPPPTDTSDHVSTSESPCSPTTWAWTECGSSRRTRPSTCRNRAVSRVVPVPRPRAGGSPDFQAHGVHGSHFGAPVAYEVYVHDAPTPGINAEFAASAYRSSGTGYRGGISGAAGIGALGTGGATNLTVAPVINNAGPGR